MPTPSELQRERPRRSIFGNYTAAVTPPPAPELQRACPACDDAPAEKSDDQALDHSSRNQQTTPRPPRPMRDGTPYLLQEAVDTAVARSFLYRFLAKAFEQPEPEGWFWLSDISTLDAVASTTRALSTDAPASFLSAASELIGRFSASAGDAFAAGYVACFGHTVRGDCPMNEIEYGDIKADPLFQPHRLADLGAFYSAFGMEMVPDAAERQDHIGIELEFMSVLTAKEAYALEHQVDLDQIDLVRDAQKKFLREHLARWTPAFTRRLARMAEDRPLGALAHFVRECILLDCARFGLAPGSEELLLRPVDEAGEKLCASCGIHNLPPGAATNE